MHLNFIPKEPHNNKIKFHIKSRVFAAKMRQIKGRKRIEKNIFNITLVNYNSVVKKKASNEAVIKNIAELVFY